MAVTRTSTVTLAVATAIALAVLLCVPPARASAQTIYRKDVSAGEATPTGSSFAVTMPVAYTDVELRSHGVLGQDIVVRSVTGATADGIRLTASQITQIAGIDPQPLQEFMNVLKAKPGVAQTLDVHHEQTDEKETLSFTLIDTAGGGNFFDVIRADDTQYTLLVQFHQPQRDEAAGMKDAFFGSFKLMKP
jgi:hypothetical protein